MTVLSEDRAARRLAAAQWSVGGAETAIERLAPDEAAVGLADDGKPHVVLMATPADLEDLAIGFTITEAIAAAPDIDAVTIAERAEGFLAEVTLAAPARQALAAARTRTLEGRSSCGLCGVQRLSAAVRALPRVASDLQVTHAAIQRALASLEAAQPLGAATRATHAAALADAEGGVRFVREDVGRHNALDKTIGAAARAGADMRAAFALVTSRCSYEMVEKAAFAGLPMIVAISAPTAMAIRKAEEAGVTLVALARADGHAVFAGAERIAP